MNKIRIFAVDLNRKKQVTIRKRISRKTQNWKNNNSLISHSRPNNCKYFRFFVVVINKMQNVGSLQLMKMKNSSLSYIIYLCIYS